MATCTAHHPVYGSCLCEKSKFHTGTHTGLWREKGAKYSHRFTWEQTPEEFLDTLADNTAELDQLERDELFPDGQVLRRVRLSEICPNGAGDF